MIRSEIEPIVNDIPAARQEVARHYGVHPYFTRRPSNVVRAYIERYSRTGDVVLDPFGGSGVTAIEAMLLGRRAIHNDLNPFANFITAAIADTTLTSTAVLRRAYERVADHCKARVEALETAEDAAVRDILSNVQLPENIRLPRSSDAEFFYDLFTPRQLAGLALIKTAIEAESDSSCRQLLLLGWSAAVAKLNKTFLSAKGRAESRGGSSIFSIYRYKLAGDVIELPIWETFHGRLLNVIAAKEEILQLRDYAEHSGTADRRINSQKQLQIFSADAANLLDLLGKDSVDYIFTDPPYGGHIAYLDLSILWNHWLRLPPADAGAEAIVGGEMRLGEEHYKSKLGESMRQCMQLLRPDRWFTVVFQHWDVSYFRVILEAVVEERGVLKAAITHDKDVIWSMHKKKNAESVLGGEMLLTFYKQRELTSRQAPTGGHLSLDELLDRFLPTVPSAGFRTETLFNKLIIEAWERGVLNNVAVNAEEMASRLQSRGWHYDAERHLWSAEEQQAASELSLAGS
jgi:adenine-specific DNA methylase